MTVKTSPAKTRPAGPLATAMHLVTDHGEEMG